MWTIEIPAAVRKQLKKLGRAEACRILDYLEEVATLDNPRSRGKGLTASKSGLWRYRIGDYRAICRIEDDRLVILVLLAGHRSTVYDD
jgi:mRNA interferase RelE/StbE